MQHPQDNHIGTQREGDVFSARQEASEVTKPADALNLNVQSPKHCKNRFLFSERHGLCYFVMSTKELTTSHCGAGEDSVSWTARSNQSILKEINPEYSSGGLMLKLQYFDHLMQSADSLGKTLILGQTEGRRRG